MTPSLDGRQFDLMTSTASRMDPDDRTRFTYHERGGAVWGEYAGGTVSLGRFVGTREGDSLDVRFVHVPVDGGAPVTGAASSRIEQNSDLLRLVEDFQADGHPQTSVCVEVR